MARITESDIDRMVKLYEKDLLPCSEIALQFGCTRQHVFYLLRKRGVDTSDHKRVVVCRVCGKSVERTRKIVRLTRNHYCSQACYMKQVASGDYQQHRHSQRLSRAVLGEYVVLHEGYSVHHMDGNDRNTSLENLVAFKTHADHMRFHRSDIPVEAFTGWNRRWENIVNRKYEPL